MRNKEKKVKECPECGSKFVEKEESILYVCEHCIGRHEE